MNDFNININDQPAPAVCILQSTIKDLVTFTITAHDGAAGRGRFVSIDTDGALVPSNTPFQGNLDGNGKFQFTIGPGNVYGSFLRGNINLEISVAGRTKSIMVRFV